MDEGDSSRKRTKGYTRKRHFVQNEYNVGVDETIIAREAREAARGPVVRGRRAPKLTTVKPPRKGKETRPNYKTMDLIEYARICQSNWYNTPRDEQIDDPNFWCMEQNFINRDIYIWITGIPSVLCSRTECETSRPSQSLLWLLKF